MSELPPQLPPRNTALLPTLAAATYVAAIVAVWGILSLLLDRDVVDYPDASTLLGPTMAAVASILTWLMLLATRRARSPWPGALLTVPLTLGGMLVVAALGYAPVAALHFALSPFILAAAALAGVTVLATWAIHPVARG